jgi:hypothetical protein
MKLAKPLLAAAQFAVLVAATSSVSAQESRWQPFVSIAPVYEGEADLDRGGDVSSWRAILRLGATGAVAPGVTAGVSFNYDYSDYSFSNPAAFGGNAPWGVVQRYGVSVPLAFALRDNWSIGVTPSFDWHRENGADSGEALSWGAILSATKLYEGGNRLGLGVGVYDRIDDTSAFPFIIVNWRLGDRWRLINPLPAGPAGGAGLELDYLFDSGWSLGLGGTWRTYRFRLSETGPVPNGIGEERGVPVFLRATREFGRGMTLNLYAGVVLAGELRVEDASGNRLRSDDYGTAPLISAVFSARF